MEWLALAIPVAFAAGKLLYFHKKVLWWEPIIPLVVSVGLIIGTKMTVVGIQVSDTEWWGGWATKAWYYEGWNERVPCRHTKTCKDSKGNSYSCGTKHIYDVDEHRPYWELHESNGSTITMDSGSTFGWGSSWAKDIFPRFEAQAQQWSNRKFVEMHRSSHTIDGDAYVSEWPGTIETLRPVTTQYRYENKVQVASSVFNFKAVDEDTKKHLTLFDYPGVDGDQYQTQILGNGGKSQIAAERKLQVANATLGADKKVRIFILIFRNQPLEASMIQEALWKGGNKNEFVLTLGVDDSLMVQWARAFSWSEVERLKVDAREFVGKNFIDARKPLDLVPVVDWLSEAIKSSFVKKSFKDFAYLDVPPPTWGYVLIFGVTALVNFGLSLWIVFNQFEEGEGFRRSGRRLGYGAY